MIIGENFIWMHFPKCAGTFTENLLKKIFNEDSRIDFDPLNPENVIWHHNVAQREKLLNKSITGKDLICNFRRLPHWIISRITFESRRSDFHVSREMLAEGRFYEMNGSVSNADRYINIYTERYVKHWIRVEHLKEDFIAAFSNYLDVKSIEASSDFTEKINVTEGILPLSHWFNEKEIQQLYASNPRWAILEKELFGNLMSDLTV